MKEKLTKNLGYKLLSLPLAALLWVIIINVDDPITPKTFNNINVDILNESYITSSGQVYDIEEGTTVNVTIKARRRILTGIKPSDIVATIDLANITKYNKVEVEVECPKYQYDINEISVKPKMLTVALEDRISVSKSVRVETTGELPDGYCVESVEVTPNIIEITGAASVIEKIAEIRVGVNVIGQQKSFSQTDLIPEVFDSDGRKINTSRLSFSHTSIDVTVNIIPTKEIPINVVMEGSALFGYAITGVEFDPESMEIAGRKKALASVTAINIPIDVTGISADTEKTIDFTEYLPEGVKLVSGTTTVAVRVKVQKMSTRDFVLSEEELDIQNLPGGYEFRFASEDQTIRITVMGLEEDLALLTNESLKASIDLTGMEPGSHYVPIVIQPLEGITLYREPKVTIMLLEPEPDETEETGEPEEPQAPNDNTPTDEETDILEEP